MRICFITPRFPFPAIKGDTLRAYHQLKALAARGHRITLVSLIDRPLTAEHFAPVRRLCWHVHVVPHPTWRAALRTAAGLFGAEPLQVAWFRNERLRRVLDEVLAADRYDAAHFCLIRMAPYAWDLVDRLPVVLDLVDSLSLNLRSRRDEQRGPLRAAYDLEYRRVRDCERAVARRFPRLVISSPVDREVLGEGARVVPNGVDLERFPFRGPAGRDPATLLFTGNMAYPPNEEAACWFARRAWPLLRERFPRLRVEIAGASPGPKLRDLAERDSRIHILGPVEDMAEPLGRATVSLCPLQSGSGIQNKVLEAMACGAPVVSTTIGNQGIQAQPERDLLVAERPEDFAEAVARLLNDAALRARLATCGRALVEDRFRWETHAKALEALYTGERAERLAIPNAPLMAGRAAAAAIAEREGASP